jgi:hypothetical protein
MNFDDVVRGVNSTFNNKEIDKDFVYIGENPYQFKYFAGEKLKYCENILLNEYDLKKDLKYLTFDSESHPNNLKENIPLFDLKFLFLSNFSLSFMENKFE